VPGRLHSWGCPVDVDLAARPMYGCSYSCVALSAPRIVMIRLCVSVASMCAGSARGLCIPCLRVVACNRELATYAEMRSYFRLTSMIIEVSSSGHIPCWCYFMRHAVYERSRFRPPLQPPIFDDRDRKVGAFCPCGRLLETQSVHRAPS
jgi:hypothetical protein